MGFCVKYIITLKARRMSTCKKTTGREYPMLPNFLPVAFGPVFGLPVGVRRAPESGVCLRRRLQKALASDVKCALANTGT